MLKIRLQRVGRKGQPSYRIVVADSRAPRGGRTVEEIGFYNPRRDPPEVRINLASARAWQAKGAQPTEIVARLLAQAS